MLSSRQGFTVRILRSGWATPVGLGFVVDKRHIVTCAHVVNVALNRDQRAQERPGPELRIGVDFPLLATLEGAPSRSCQVKMWAPPPGTGVSGGDLAGLVLIGDELPTGAYPAQLAEQVSSRNSVLDVFGYPSDPPRQDRGAWTAVHLRGVVGDGLIQLDPASESTIKIQPGYSGSPIVGKGDAGDEVLGMLAVASRKESYRDAYAIPVAKLASEWPDVLGSLTVPKCPYRGLAAFTIDDAEAGVFVGREEEARQLWELVRRQELVIVTGPSGVGKSSLVNAGLARILRDERWITRTFRPGGMPFDALAVTLLEIEHEDRSPTLDDLVEYADRLRSDGLTRLMSQLSLPKKKPIILCVDQLEQVLDPGICAPTVSGKFLEMLLQAQSFEEVRVVCTLRTDFLTPLLQHPDAASRLRDRLFPVSPMSRMQIKRVITEPAEVRGVRYEPGLAELITHDAGDGGGRPLLGFALAKLWPQQRQRRITLEEYHGIDGVMGALRAYAEDVYRELLERFAKDEIRRVMLVLVRSRGGSSEATRRVVTRQWLGNGWNIAEALAERRLVVLDYDPIKDEESAQIAHEALIREWPRFATWVDDDADFQYWLAALEERVVDGDILPDKRLAEADRWLSERADDVPSDVRRLVQDSKSEWLRRVTELDQMRVRAEEAAREAKARRLAAASELAVAVRASQKNLAIVLAVESLRILPTIEGDIAARHALSVRQRGRLGRDSQILAVAYSPDGTQIIVAGSDGNALIVDADTGTELLRLNHGAEVWAVAFSPDGKRVATGSGDHSARVFSATTGTLISRVDHDDTVWAVVFSQDGTRVATGSHDRSARVFNADTGREMCRMDHDDAVLAVAFNPHGTRVSTGSPDLTRIAIDSEGSNPREWIVDQHDFINCAGGQIENNLTPSEWQRYFGDEPYRQTRSDLGP